MRRGCHPYLNRFAPLLTRTAAATAAEIAHLITGKTPASAAAIFLALVLAGQAQESIQEVALPPWSESTLPSSEPAPSAQAETVPSAPEPLPAAPAEPLPASEEVFPSSSDSWSSLTNYTTAQTTVVPAPAAGGPYGEFSTKNVSTGGAASSGEPRRCHYALQLTEQGVWDDNIFISHTDRKSDYYFAIEPDITLGVGDIEGRNRSYLRLDYMPSAILFVNHSDQDAFNQLIHLEGGYSTGRLRLCLFEDTALLESANLNSFFDTTGLWANTDASAPTRMNIFYTRLTANYALSGKISLQGEFGSSIFFYPNNISDYTVSGGLYVYYNWLPKVTVGIGGTFGYDWVDDPTANQSFEQVNLRLNYDVTA